MFVLKKCQMKASRPNSHKVMYDNDNKETVKLSLKEVQKCSFEILKSFRDFCNEHDLRYQLAYGTLLGAVRHKGFIPWDDDIDVMMPRPDFLKLESIIVELPSRYGFLSINTHSKYSSPLAKIYDKSTLAIQHYDQIDIPKFGVYIDIFILDGLPNSKFAKKLFFKFTNLLRRAWGLSIGRWAHEQKKTKKYLKIICALPFRIFGYRFWLRIYNEFCSLFDFQTHKYVGVVQFGEGLNKESFNKSIIEKTVSIMFNGELFNVPNNFDGYLSQMYQNFMELPPQDLRVSKHKTDFYRILRSNN